jgi:hypothetical protein
MPAITAAGYFTRTWEECSSLQSFDSPSILYIYGDVAPGYTPSRTFYNCHSLISLPTLITSACSGFGSTPPNAYTFAYCRSLTSFPEIDTSNVLYFYGTWEGCISLSASYFPTLNMSKMIQGTDCFRSVKLQTHSWSSLLTSICATNNNTNVAFHGGDSKRNMQGSLAYQHLTNIKSWSITDGGEE